MLKFKSSSVSRIARHKRLRKNIAGVAERPRLAVFRSNKNIFAQIIDDSKGHTLVAVNSLQAEVKDLIAGKNKKEQAEIIGAQLGEKAKAAGICKVVFDRGGYLYHGRVKALAEGARKAGLEF